MLTIKKQPAKHVVLLLALTVVLAGCTPKGPRALLNGRKAIERGRYADAIERLKLATSLLGTNAPAWNELGLAYHYSRQITNAAQAYQRALDLNHDLMEARYNLGCLWLEENRLDAARLELTTFTLRRSGSGEGWLKLGTVQLRLRDLAGAEKSFTEALHIDPRNIEALNGLGVVYFQRNHQREAVQCFNNALHLRSDYPPALLNCAIASQLFLNNRSQALEKYEEYLALPVRGPEWEAASIMAHSLEAEAAAASHPNQPAAPPAPVPARPPADSSTVHPAAVSRPEPPVANNRPPPSPPAAMTANVETVKLPPETVVKPASETITSTPPSASHATSAPNNAAPSADKRGLPPRARTETPKGVSTTTPAGASGSIPRYRYHQFAAPVPGDRSDAEQALAKGVQEYRAGHLNEAMQAYRQATQTDPTYFDAYYNLGLAAVEAGNLPAALLAYETAVALRPDSLDGRYNFALALKQANYPVDAADECERVLAAYPNEPRAHLTLANLCAQQLQQPARARQHYLKVLEIEPRTPQAGAIRYWLQSNPP